MKCKKDGKGQAESSRSSHTLPSTVSGLHTWQPRLSYIPLGQRTALAALRQCWSRCLGEWLARVVEIPIAKIQRAPIQVFCQMPNGSTFYAAKKTKVKRQRTVPRLATLRLARWVSAKLAALSLWAEFRSAKVKVSCVYREAPQKKVTELEVVLIVRFHCAGTSRNFLCKCESSASLDQSMSSWITCAVSCTALLGTSAFPMMPRVGPTFVPENCCFHWPVRQW